MDDFCKTVLARQSESRYSAFFEDNHGVLKRRHQFEPAIVQVVLPRTVCARLLQLCHNTAFGGTRARIVCTTGSVACTTGPISPQMSQLRCESVGPVR